MTTNLDSKSTIKEIQKRFDNDVERFSNLETGQQAVIDASYMLDLISKMAFVLKADARNILDVGCGAGNNTLKILKNIPNLNCDLLDLSSKMLDKAYSRVSKETSGDVNIYCDDIRKANLTNQYDIIVGAAVFHHLRETSDWEETFKKIYELTAPGGALLITDMFFHDNKLIQDYFWENYYREYLINLGGVAYSEKVFQYIDKEDSPRSIEFHSDLLKAIGFKEVSVLHKNVCFGALLAVK